MSVDNRRFLGVSGTVTVSNADEAAGVFAEFHVLMREEDGSYSGELVGPEVEIAGSINGLKVCPAEGTCSFLVN